ncbi:MAG: T9SS type A sorting domain-containing protein [Reichenbachiella sp.]
MKILLQLLLILVIWIPSKLYGQEYKTVLNEELNNYGGFSYRVMENLKLTPGFKVNASTDGTFRAYAVDFNQFVYVPDDSFEQRLIDLGYDDVLDNFILRSTASTITSISINGVGYTVLDFTGIEAFVSLEELFVTNQINISSLDISKNTQLKVLYLAYCKMTELDVTKNTSLISLHCSNCDISQLDLSNNSELTHLNLNSNEMSQLNISANTSLAVIKCKSNNLTSLDISANTSLTVIDCSYNNLTSLDVSNHIDLTELNCKSNLIQCIQVNEDQYDETSPNWDVADYWDKDEASFFSYTPCNELELVAIPDIKFEQRLIQNNHDHILDGYVYKKVTESIETLVLSSSGIVDLKGIEAFTSITSLHCTGNNLKTIDLSNNTELLNLYSSSINLTNLTFYNPSNIRRLSISSINSTSLDLSSFTSLKQFSCSNSNLTSLDLSKNVNLESLNLQKDNITSIDLSKNVNLERLILSSNNITSIDLSKNVNLEKLDLYYNKITSIDLSKNVNLEELILSSNNFTSLDISKNTSLTKLYINWGSLTNLDVSSNINLTSLDTKYNFDLECIQINNNQLNDTDLLDSWRKQYAVYSLDCAGESGARKLDFSEAVKIENEIFNLYPNPAQGHFTIEVSNSEEMSMHVYDLTGTLLYDRATLVSGPNRFQTQQFSEGFVMIVLTDQEGISITKKLLIQH